MKDIAGAQRKENMKFKLKKQDAKLINDFIDNALVGATYGTIQAIVNDRYDESCFIQEMKEIMEFIMNTIKGDTETWLDYVDDSLKENLEEIKDFTPLYVSFIKNAEQFYGNLPCLTTFGDRLKVKAGDTIDMEYYGAFSGVFCGKDFIFDMYEYDEEEGE